ncbi:recombinase family protein [Actinopolymorpha pittospori]|uniref:Resolvase/invertase-type recombinase catalytic domain-containing protein n=1 Tax=Actinopolymorpha pittospori TaxID=648752 RepID=A0A927RM49_9ACTN|nr:hypothetical protein [Actinopolymorpha pittospori]
MPSPAAVRDGDTLVVSKLDRLARTVPDARDIGDSLAERGIRLSLGVVLPAQRSQRLGGVNAVARSDGTPGSGGVRRASAGGASASRSATSRRVVTRRTAATPCPPRPAPHSTGRGQFLDTVRRRGVGWQDWDVFGDAMDQWSNGYVLVQRQVTGPDAVTAAAGDTVETAPTPTTTSRPS